MLSVAGVRAQYDAVPSHYFDMETFFCPAAAGKQSKLNVTAAYALDFAGFEHNPRTMYVGADMPLYFAKAYHGVGLQVMNDQIGLFTHQRLAAQYAYKHKLWGGTLSVGVQVGMLSEKFDGGKLDVEESGDPALSTADVSGTSLDVAAGLYYVHGRWYAGAGAQHLTAPLVKLGETNELQIDRTYYLTAGYNIRLRNPFLTIKPTALVRTDGSAWRGDITGRLVYTHEQKVLYGGVGVSPTNSVTFLVGGSFHGVMLGYSYELYTAAMNPGNGSHALMLSYQHDINMQKRGRNKHKSVRLL